MEPSDETEITWPEVTARAHSRLRLTSEATTYAFDLDLDVYQDGEPIRSRHWHTVTTRKLQ